MLEVLDAAERSPLTTIITRVVIASVAVTQMLAVAVPPMWRSKAAGMIAAIGNRPSRLSVSTKKKTVQMYLMKRSVCSPRLGRATSSRKYWQIASIALPKPLGTRRSISLPPFLRRKVRGRTRMSRNPASTIMLMWSEKRVTLPSGVSGPASSDCWTSGCCTT